MALKMQKLKIFLKSLLQYYLYAKDCFNFFLISMIEME